MPGELRRPHGGALRSKMHGPRDLLLMALALAGAVSWMAATASRAESPPPSVVRTVAEVVDGRAP